MKSLLLIAACLTMTLPPMEFKTIDSRSEDLRKLQADRFANPGMGFVAAGERLWNEPLASGPACSQCHKDASVSMKGVAAKYPRYQPKLGRVVNLEGRIDACNRRHQEGAGLAAESEPLLALTAYVAHQSLGMPIEVDTSGPAKPVLEAGERLYKTRIGQMNLACTNCHDAMAGRTLLGEIIGAGHGAGWPAYRLEWQTLGSLSRRLRACFFGVRAEQPAFGAEELIALELYLAARGQGIAMESPGVRR